MRGLEKIYGKGTDRHACTHFNTVNRPGLRAGSIENVAARVIGFTVHICFILMQILVVRLFCYIYFVQTDA